MPQNTNIAINNLLDAKGLRDAYNRNEQHHTCSTYVNLSLFRQKRKLSKHCFIFDNSNDYIMINDQYNVVPI